MLHLPYLPQPFPDEIFGSWLARISMHNGRGAWVKLLESAGYGLNIKTPHFDLIDYSEKLEKLLNSLDTNYESVVLELTTLPYWLTFDSDNLENSPLRGTSNVARIYRRGKKELRSITNLGINRRLHVTLRPRYCPLCLQHDFATYGEPYWHRSHQLPNVLLCPHHLYRLQTACPSCGLDMTTIAERLIDLPRYQCRCGYNLYLPKSFAAPTNAEVMLMQVSVQALMCSRPEWNYEHVRAHLQTLLDAYAHSDIDSVDSALSIMYNATEEYSHNADNTNAIPPSSHHSISRLRIAVKNYKAPECCAILAALGINLTQAKRGFLQMASVDTKMTVRSKLSSRSLTIDDARQEILHRVNAYPNSPVSEHRRLYWFLQINDPQWLQTQFPNVLIQQIPSTYHDRRKIIGILKDHRISAGIRKRKIENSSAGVRARLRDQEWLSRQFDLLLNNIKKKASLAVQARYARRASDIADALHVILKNENKPKRVCATDLAARLGLSQLQVSKTIAMHPQLRRDIEIANRDKNRRLLLWAARQLQSEGCNLSASKIRLRAGLKYSAATKKLARQIVEGERHRNLTIHAM